jgi:hypothetical protein
MKTRIVSGDAIAASPGLRLDAGYYVDPTRNVDMQIAAAERAVAKATARLTGLKAKRAAIIEEKRHE